MEPWPSHMLGKASKAVWVQGSVLEQEAEVRSDILSEGNSFRAPQRFLPPRPPLHKDFGGRIQGRGRSVPKPQLSHTVSSLPTEGHKVPVLLGWPWEEQRLLEWAPEWTEKQGRLSFVEETRLHPLGSLLSFYFTCQSLSLLVCEAAGVSFLCAPGSTRDPEINTG